MIPHNFIIFCYQEFTSYTTAISRLSEELSAVATGRKHNSKRSWESLARTMIETDEGQIRFGPHTLIWKHSEEPYDLYYHID